LIGHGETLMEIGVGRSFFNRPVMRLAAGRKIRNAKATVLIADHLSNVPTKFGGVG